MIEPCFFEAQRPFQIVGLFLLEAVLKLILPLLSDALLPCHSEPFGFAQDKLRVAESKERGTTARFSGQFISYQLRWNRCFGYAQHDKTPDRRNISY